ncbi:MAG: hypothetical protein J6S07_09060 [Bacteroidaceae bacterium]|nr:hypothetical protein [Bacteroidaceae bacterium]
MKDYRIAGHIVSLDFADSSLDEGLLPNLAPFAYEGEETPAVTIRIVSDHEWEQDGQDIGTFDVGGSDYAVFHTAQGGYRFDIHDTNGHLCCRMQSNPDFSLCHAKVYDGTNAQQHYGLNNCMMLAFAYATATKDTLLIHSSVIRCDGKGYLMTAPSGTGKSTHTYLWYTNIPGCDLMNDDNPVIRIVDGKPIVYGSPWSGKTPCYRNIEAPIGGIVRIKQHSENIVRRLSTIEAFTVLLPACSSMKWDARIYNGICDSITKIIQTCKLWELQCLPDSEAAILCHDTISKESNS